MHVATLALDDLLIVQARDGLEWIQCLVAHFIACNLTDHTVARLSDER